MEAIKEEKENSSDNCKKPRSKRYSSYFLNIMDNIRTIVEVPSMNKKDSKRKMKILLKSCNEYLKKRRGFIWTRTDRRRKQAISNVAKLLRSSANNEVTYSQLLYRLRPID